MARCTPIRKASSRILTSEAMTEEDIKIARQEYVTAAKNAIEAGFGGVELHGAEEARQKRKADFHVYY